MRLTGAVTSTNKYQLLLSKIVKEGQLLGALCNINSGCDITISKITNKNLQKFSGDFSKGDGVFVLSKNELDSLMLNEEEQSIIKDFIKNSDIYKYGTLISKEKLIYLKWEDDISRYPNVKRHLLRFKNILEDQSRRYEENYPWFALHRPREEKIFTSSEKILVPYRSKKNVFGFYEKPVYSSRDVFFISPTNNELDIKYILALLNSKLYYFWLYQKGKRKGEVLELYYKPLSEIPIKCVTSKEQKSFTNVVDKILSITKSGGYLQSTEKQVQVKEYEKQIDQMIYKLYGLTPEEIEIVEKNTR